MINSTFLRIGAWTFDYRVLRCAKFDRAIFIKMNMPLWGRFSPFFENQANFFKVAVWFAALKFMTCIYFESGQNTSFLSINCRRISLLLEFWLQLTCVGPHLQFYMCFVICEEYSRLPSFLHFCYLSHFSFGCSILHMGKIFRGNCCCWGDFPGICCRPHLIAPSRR